MSFPAKMIWFKKQANKCHPDVWNANRLLCPGIIDILDPFGLKSSRLGLTWNPLMHLARSLIFTSMTDNAFIGWRVMFPKQCWPFLDGLKPKSLLVDLNWIFLIFQTGDNVQCNIYIYIYICMYMCKMSCSKAFSVTSCVLDISHYAVVVFVHHYCAYRKLWVRFNLRHEFPCCWGKPNSHTVCVFGWLL